MLFFRLKNLYYHYRTQESLSKSDFQEAMKYLMHLFKLYKFESPSTSSPLHLNLLYAYICAKVDKLRSFEACGLVLSQIKNKTYSSVKYTEFDANYIHYYCKLILIEITDYVDSTAFDLAKNIVLQYKDIKPLLTNKHIRDLFPMDPKLAEDYDRYVIENS